MISNELILDLGQSGVILLIVLCIIFILLLVCFVIPKSCIFNNTKISRIGKSLIKTAALT